MNIIIHNFQNLTYFYKFPAMNTHLGCSIDFDGHHGATHYISTLLYINFLHMQAFASAFSTQLTPNSTQSRANSYLQAFLLKTHLGDHFYHKIRSQEHKTQPYYLPRTPKVQDSTFNFTCRAGIQGLHFSQVQMAMVRGLGAGFFCFPEINLY
jgi:hypothetical protein